MCLNTVTKRVEKPSKKVTRAWKVFYKDPQSNELKSFYYDWIQPIVCGRWQTAKEVELETNSDTQKYPSGFHCYTNKEQAERFNAENLEKSYCVLLEVKVKEITTYGTQWTEPICDTIVARQMLVPRQPKVKK